MNKRIFSCLLAVSALALIWPQNARAVSDAQYWNTTSLKIKLHQNLNLLISEELRFGHDMGTLYYMHTDIGLSYNIFGWFGLAAIYRQIFDRRGEDYDLNYAGWRREYRPMLDIFFSFPGKGFRIFDRNRLDFRIIEDSKNDIRYRNLLDVSVPIMVKKVEIAPFSADELFIDITNGCFDKNRFYIGMRGRFTKNLGVGIYYMWEAIYNQTYWLNYSVAGSQLFIDF